MMGSRVPKMYNFCNIIVPHSVCSMEFNRFCAWWGKTACVWLNKCLLLNVTHEVQQCGLEWCYSTHNDWSLFGWPLHPADIQEKLKWFLSLSHPTSQKHSCRSGKTGCMVLCLTPSQEFLSGLFPRAHHGELNCLLWVVCRATDQPVWGMYLQGAVMAPPLPHPTLPQSAEDQNKCRD